jgi:hypothetical protein
MRKRLLTLTPLNPLGSLGLCHRKSRLHLMSEELLASERCGIKLFNSRTDPFGTSQITLSTPTSTPSSLDMACGDVSMYHVPPAQPVC